MRRRITPWRRRLRGHIDVPDLGGGDDIIGVIGLIIAIPFLIVAAIALSEFLLLLLLIPLYVLIRIAFKRPWAIDVSRGNDHVATESVVGWRAAGLRMHEVAEQINGGRFGAENRPVTPTADPSAALEHACVWGKTVDERLLAVRTVEATNRQMAVHIHERDERLREESARAAG